MVAASLSAQEAIEPSRTLTVRRATGPLRIDGRLDEADWARADSITDFRQREPEVGASATERTVVKVLRDDDGLIIGIRAADREPALIRATQLRRDADFEGDDYITLLIDSFHDRRSGFLFATNPNAAMWDAQLVGTEDEDDNWNGIWTVATTRDEGGWAAEFKIPFRTLRFESGADGVFGFNVLRFIPRKNEEVLWQAWGRQQGLYRLQYAGDLTGLGVLARTRDIELKPFVLARAYAPERDVEGVTTSPASSGAKVGLDAKVAVSPTLTADLTANTDFAQVEADRQVINLSRFPLFFPEKRDFFLESADIFAFGTSSQARLFYSRRIGVLDGREVPILGGARLYGRSGAWTLGLLDARTGGVDAANDAVVRVKHDVFERSYLGALLTHRSGPGVDGAEAGFGVDGNFPLVVGDQNIQPAFWLAGTRAPSVSATPLAWRASLDYPNDLFDNFVSLSRIDSAFNPALGFVQRAGLLQSTGSLRYRPRPRIPGIRQLELMPVPAWTIVADHSGRLTDSRTWQTAEFEWRPFAGELRSGGDFEFNIQREFDAPTEDFDVFGDVTIPAGRYWFTRWQAQASTSSARALSGEIAATWGEYYDGRSTELQLAGTWRGGGHVILGAEASRTSATLSTGSFVAVETAGRLEYAFNPRTSFLGFVQYNNEDRRADFNLRFHWIPTIGDDVYLVWNSGYTTDPDARFRFPSSRALTRPLNGAFVIKAVHRFVP